MSKPDKIKLGVAVGVLVVAAVLVYFQFRGSVGPGSTIDPERRVQGVEPPLGLDGKPQEVFGNRGVAPK